MSGTKISALPALGAAPATDDLVPLVDTSAGATKSVTVAFLFTSPAFITPTLGTPVSGNLASCTGLPAAGVTGTAAILGANTFTGIQKLASGTDAAPSLAFSSSTNYGLALNASLAGFNLVANGAGVARVGPALFAITSAGNFGFTSNTTDNNLDSGISRTTAKVLRFSDGGANANGWVQWAGQSRVAGSNVTNSTATMAAITGLTATLAAGRAYNGKIILYVADSVAAEGIKVDFDGGNATMTSFRAHGTLFDTALLLSTQTTAIATDFAVATCTGDSMVEIYFSMVVNAGGTFIPQFAQNTHAAGTATCYVGSHMLIFDCQ